MMRVTIACPTAMIGDANQLALCLGQGVEDGETYGAAIWADAAGRLYAVASVVVSEDFPLAAMAPLVAPVWGADVIAARRAQAAIAIGASAAPGRIAAIFGDDAQEALAQLGLVPSDAWPQ